MFLYTLLLAQFLQLNRFGFSDREISWSPHMFCSSGENYSESVFPLKRYCNSEHHYILQWSESTCKPITKTKLSITSNILNNHYKLRNFHPKQRSLDAFFLFLFQKCIFVRIRFFTRVVIFQKISKLISVFD